MAFGRRFVTGPADAVGRLKRAAGQCPIPPPGDQRTDQSVVDPATVLPRWPASQGTRERNDRRKTSLSVDCRSDSRALWGRRCRWSCRNCIDKESNDPPRRKLFRWRLSPREKASHLSVLRSSDLRLSDPSQRLRRGRVAVAATGCQSRSCSRWRLPLTCWPGSNRSSDRKGRQLRSARMEGKDAG
jgi:hypothetical protein